MADTRRETIEIVRQDGISMAVMKLDYSQVPVHIQIGSGTSSSAKPWNYEKFDPEFGSREINELAQIREKEHGEPLAYLSSAPGWRGYERLGEQRRYRYIQS